MVTFHLLHVQQMPILEQLRLEEALLRSDERNWCLINEGTPPAIVMGISGKAEELISPQAAVGIPVIRRFSGGGCVVVDENTLFVTFICQKEVHPFPPYPEPILRWCAGFYSFVPGFHVRENDYVIGERKCGGNAQYIRKDRWLQHTCFLWDYRPERMGLLLHPPKSPQYREGRSHEEFLCCLRQYLPSKESFVAGVKKNIYKSNEVKEISTEEATRVCQVPHRQSVVAENSNTFY